MYNLFCHECVSLFMYCMKCSYLYLTYFAIVEQQYFDVEKQLVSSNNKLESETSTNAELKDTLAQLGKYSNKTKILS